MDWTPAMTETTDKQCILACPQRSHILLAHTPHFSNVATQSNFVWRYLILSLFYASHWTRTQEQIRPELYKQKAGPNIAASKPTGWLQITLHFLVLFLPPLPCCIFSLHNHQFNCTYILAQSTHLHLNTSYRALAVSCRLYIYTF